MFTYIYAFSSNLGTQPLLKIGISAVQPEDKRKELNTRYNIDFGEPIVLVPGDKVIEDKIHSCLKHYQFYPLYQQMSSLEDSLFIKRAYPRLCGSREAYYDCPIVRMTLKTICLAKGQLVNKCSVSDFRLGFMTIDEPIVH